MDSVCYDVLVLRRLLLLSRPAKELSPPTEADSFRVRPRAPLYSLASRIHTQAALYNNPQSAEDVDALFSDGFHPKLKGEAGHAAGVLLGATPPKDLYF